MITCSNFWISILKTVTVKLNNKRYENFEKNWFGFRQRLNFLKIYLNKKILEIFFQKIICVLFFTNLKKIIFTIVRAIFSNC